MKDFHDFISENRYSMSGNEPTHLPPREVYEMFFARMLKSHFKPKYEMTVLDADTRQELAAILEEVYAAAFDPKSVHHKNGLHKDMNRLLDVCERKFHAKQFERQDARLRRIRYPS